MTKLLTPSIFLFFLVLFINQKSCFIHHPRAQSFSSQNYRIQWGNFNITSGKKTSATYQLTDTVGQNAPGPYSNTRYKVKSGFQYIYPFDQFSFKISELDINFGSLVADTGTTALTQLTVTTPSGHGYEVYSAEIHPLQALGSGLTIPDTRCDAGTCTESTAAVWTQSTTYGFGFNASGIGTSAYFTGSTYYRQFANLAQNELPQILMAEALPVKNHQSQITYKVNIPAVQPAGEYQTSVIFTAIPKY